MRFSLVLCLLLAALVMNASAQKHQKPKAKPSYSEEKDAKSPARAVRPPSNHSSSQQELHRLEQSSAKTPNRTQGKAARTGPVLKSEKQERNPPIQFASTGSGSKGSKGKQGGNETKGRLRHKGSHR